MKEDMRTQHEEAVLKQYPVHGICAREKLLIDLQYLEHEG